MRLIDQYWTERCESGHRLGLSPDFADSIPGDWVGLELAGPGRLIHAKDTFGFLTTSIMTHDLRAPEGFRVVRVNPELLGNANLAKLSPRGAGWLMEVAPLETTATA